MANQTVETDEVTAGIGPNQPLRLVGVALVVLLWIADLLTNHTHVEKVLGLVLIAVLIQAAVGDIEDRRIRNRLTVPAAVAALLIGVVMHPKGVPAQVLWGLGAGAFMMFFAIISRGGLGMGDVKLAVVMGLFLSKYVLVALLVGLLASGVFSLGVLAVRGVSAGRKTKIPLGPFLALGGVVAVLAGPSLMHGT